MIIDAFLFFNEIDILELRLNELHDVVDQFVIVEGLETFSGQPHESVLANHQFGPKVKYVSVPTLSPAYTDVQSGWERERFLRSQLWPAVLDVSKSPDDVVIVSDVDEIPRPEIVLNTAKNISNGMHRLSLDFFYYNVNCFLGPLSSPTIGTLSQYEKFGGTHDARSWGNQHIPVENAGWHFSYFGGLDRIKNKVKSFSHSQDDFCKEFLARSDEEAKKDIDARQDLFRRPELNKFEYRASDDPRLPQTFLNNIERYKHFTEEGMWSRAEIAEKF